MMSKRFVMSMILGGTLALGSSVGTSWAFDMGGALIEKMERLAVETADKTARTLADKGGKELDKNLSEPSDSKAPPKNQSTPETTPPKADTARPIQENPKEGSVNKH